MSAPLRIAQVDAFPLKIPMRVRFEHASASRAVADPIVLRLAPQSPYETPGFGETLARGYVTGESEASVREDLERVFVPRLMDFRAESLSEALERIDALPFAAGGRCIQAARAAVELALLDLAGKAFGRRVADIAGWLDFPPTLRESVTRAPRYSGIVIGRGRRKLTWLLRGQGCLGLRDFKLKAAVEGWEQRLRWTHELLRGALRTGRCTLRVDANGGWTPEQARQALPLLESCGVSVIEQPLAPQDDAHLPALAAATSCAIMADESLVTLADLERLIAGGAVRVFNIRIAKAGGLLAALRMAARARSAGRDVQLGCLVGETSILSAAGAAFLELFPGVRFAEGAFGRWMLRADVARPVVQFGWGGRAQALRRPGLGVDVDSGALARFAGEDRFSIRL